MDAAVKAAIVAKLTTVFPTWTYVDTENTVTRPDVASPFVTIRRGAGGEEKFSFGSPGSNLYRERAVFYVTLCVAPGDGVATAGGHVKTIRDGFRNAEMTTVEGTPRRVVIDDTHPSFGDFDETDGWWKELIPVAYRVFNIG